MLSSMPERDSSYPKPLSAWFDLDYFRRRRSWFSLGDHFLRMRRRENLKWIVIAVVILGCIGWPLTAQITGNRRIYQAHPVSTAHAMFNDHCEWCHTGSFKAVSRFSPRNADRATVTDETCKQCHNGPIHHEKAIEERHCAGCHREHRGQVELARVSDLQCTFCHADLAQHAHGGTSLEKVSAWSAHPDFGLLRRDEKDPGTVLFNHAKHLNPEGVRDGNGAPKNLECRTCHIEDTAGRYMQPISYDTHCSRCHPLDVKVAGKFKDDKIIRAPHKEPIVVHAALRDELTRLVQNDPSILSAAERTEPPRPLPGRPRQPQVTEKQWSWVSAQLESAERVLFEGDRDCRYCHQVKTSFTGKRLPEYAPTNIQARWFKQSIFSHRSHQAVLCVECHKKAPRSALTSDVLLPEIGTCMKCHKENSGARSDCVECHFYHDRRLAKPPMKMNIMELLGNPAR